MADGIGIDAGMVNALLAALQRQREEALNKLAQAEANNAMLAAEIAKLQERAEDRAEETEET